MDKLKWLREYDPRADEHLRPQGDTSVLTRYLRECAAEMGALRELAAELDDRQEYSLCDCCGNLSMDTADDDGEGNPLGHVQCEQCSRMASLEHRLGQYRAALEDIARQRLGETMDEDEYLNADFAGGHDECVKRAKGALSDE